MGSSHSTESGKYFYLLYHNAYSVWSINIVYS